MGLRGSGKSTLGRAIAQREGRRFVDLDEVSASFLSSDSVAEAWSRFGEPAFRAAEAQALAAALLDDGTVIALGGGTPTAPGVAELIEHAKNKRRCVVAYLRCEPAELRSRLMGLDEAAMTNRPSLTGGHPLDEIESVFAARDPLYRKLASREIEGVRSIDEALDRFAGWRGW